MLRASKAQANMLRFLVYWNKNCSAYSCKRQGRRRNFDYFTNRRLSARQKLEGGMTGVTGRAAGRWSNHDSLRCVDATTLKATSGRYIERCVLAHISVIYLVFFCLKPFQTVHFTVYVLFIKLARPLTFFYFHLETETRLWFCVTCMQCSREFIMM